MLAQFYIYRHIRPDTNEVFYIGKGKHRRNRSYERAYSKNRRSRFWERVVAKNQGNYTVEIVAEFETSDECIAKECELIALYGRANQGKGSLVNLTDGGDGRRGIVMTDEEYRHRSESIRGAKHYNFGKKLSELTCFLKSIAVRGEKHHLYGRSLPDEWRENLSLAKIGSKNPMYGKYGADHPNSKQVVNRETGIVYDSIAEAAKAEGVSVKMLYQYLDGSRRNPTALEKA